MRQVGIIAAAGLYAVQNNISRLSEDHLNARSMAESLNELETFNINLDLVQTNIILADTTGENTAAAVLNRMSEIGVLAVPFGQRRIRFVAHLDVSRKDCLEAVERIRGVLP